MKHAYTFMLLLIALTTSFATGPQDQPVSVMLPDGQVVTFEPGLTVPENIKNHCGNDSFAYSNLTYEYKGTHSDGTPWECTVYVHTMGWGGEIAPPVDFQAPVLSVDTCIYASPHYDDPGYVRLRLGGSMTYNYEYNIDTYAMIIYGEGSILNGSSYQKYEFAETISIHETEEFAVYSLSDMDRIRTQAAFTLSSWMSMYDFYYVDIYEFITIYL